MHGKFFGDRAGNFYFFVETMDIHPENGFTYLDNTLNIRQEIKLSGEILDAFEDTEGNLYWYGVNGEGATIHSLKNDEVFLEGFEDINRYEYKAGFSTTGRLYMADTRNIWLVGEETESVFNFTQKDYIINDLYSMEAGEAGDMRFLVELDGECTLLTLKESNTPPVTEKQEIILAFANEHLALNKAIARFNRQSDKYHVSVLKPEDGESMSEFAERLQLEISAGRGPDMLGHDVIYDITPYVENGYLECLDDVIMDDSAYLQAALEGCRIDGKLYGIPYDCTLNFAVYPEAFTEGRSSWSMAEMMKAVEDSGVKILQPGCSGMSIVMDYALRDNSDTTYIDWETGESHLTEKPFLELLAFAKKYSDSQNQRQETGRLIAEGEAFAVVETMRETCRMNYLYACFQDSPAPIGYPRTNAVALCPW
ncbi:MAG: extracellular solute-binding protein, partial [Lachnospiraceae bacterium]|nr:extracellular solute-binding protein [Lachnospiraceae bacterium]